MSYKKGSKFFNIETFLEGDIKSVEIIEKVAYIQNLKQKGIL